MCVHSILASDGRFNLSRHCAAFSKHTNLCICICMFVCVCVCVFVDGLNFGLRLVFQLHQTLCCIQQAHEYVYVRVCAYVSMCVCVCVHLTYMYMCVCVRMLC